MPAPTVDYPRFHTGPHRCDARWTFGRPAADASRIFLVASVFLGGVLPALATDASPRVLVRWTFGGEHGWAGWTPNAGIEAVQFATDHVALRARGADPQMLGPEFELPAATNDQWVEIDVECEGTGEGEVFFTSKTTGRYRGLEPHWTARLVVARDGRQTLRVWPFWESLGRVVRLRVDPPSGTKWRLHSVAIAEAPARPATPSWSFTPREPRSWLGVQAVRVEISGGELRAAAAGGPALLLTPVAPFDAAARSVLRLDARCPGEPVLGIYWATREEPGLHGEPLELATPDGLAPREVDLRRFPTWTGTVTHLGLGFATRGDETLIVRSIAVGENDPERPFFRLLHLDLEPAIRRPDRPATLRATLELAAGKLPRSPLVATLAANDRLELPETRVRVPALDAKGRAQIEVTAAPRRAGHVEVSLALADQTFTRRVRIDPAIAPSARDDYAVPTPQPVETRYRIGVYYFPGWSADQLGRWRKQAAFPEREPVLGWYREGDPEVADWHIKWAVEHGISFFVYDWYWRNGRDELGAALDDGFLQARYRDRMQFALMWANHAPFSSHTREQLVQVTGVWIERYFRRANYLTVDGRPYVSFFSPSELIGGLGSEEAVAEALEAMRERVRSAGRSGLHIAACAGGERPDPRVLKRCGFDSITAYNHLRTGAVTRQSSYRQFVLGHEAIWEGRRADPVLPHIPVLTVGWDSRPWHGPRAERKFARRTRDFADALERLRAFLDATGGDTAVLEAWNEWGEGSYLEPNATFGFEDLEAIRRVFCEPGDWPLAIAPVDVGLDGAYDVRRTEGR